MDNKQRLIELADRTAWAASEVHHAAWSAALHFDANGNYRYSSLTRFSVFKANTVRVNKKSIRIGLIITNDLTKTCRLRTSSYRLFAADLRKFALKLYDFSISFEKSAMQYDSAAKMIESIINDARHSIKSIDVCTEARALLASELCKSDPTIRF